MKKITLILAVLLIAGSFSAYAGGVIDMIFGGGGSSSGGSSGGGTQSARSLGPMTWTDVDVSTTFGTSDINAVAYGNNRWVAGGDTSLHGESTYFQSGSKYFHAGGNYRQKARSAI